MIGTHAYDVLDRRIAKTVDGTITAYIYDMSSGDPLAHDDILLEFDATAAPAILTRRWAHSDSVDEPLGFEAYSASGGAGTGSERAVFADRQGSVVWVTDPATGDVVAAYEYDGFGQLTQPQGALSQPYGYTGREYDAESGLYYYRARNYDPASGVFLQSDPAGFSGSGPNLYSYSMEDPYGWVDPSGLNSVNASIGTGLGVTGARAGIGTVGSGSLRGVWNILRALSMAGSIHIVTSESNSEAEKERLAEECVADYEALYDAANRLYGTCMRLADFQATPSARRGAQQQCGKQRAWAQREAADDLAKCLGDIK